MIKGIGTDIVEIDRLQSAVTRTGDKLLKRVLTAFELDTYQQKSQRDQRQGLHYFAKRYAAKEAIAKALGTGIGRGVSWQDMEISNNDQGAPLVTLSGGARDKMQAMAAEQCLLSISDEQAYAIAYAVLD